MYEKYSFFDNPFKAEHDHEMVGESQNKTFDALLDMFSVNMASKEGRGDKFLAVLKGDYGIGKSFFLIKLSESIINRDERFKKILKQDVKIAVAKFPILTEDKKLPTNILIHLYRRIIENLGLNGEQFLLQLYKDLESEAKLKNKDIKKFLEDLPREYQKAILALSEESKQYYAWKWLSAQRLKKQELDELDLKYSIDSAELAEKYLFCLLKLLYLAEYKLFVVFIDELEQIFTLVNEKKFWTTFVIMQEVFDKFADVKYAHLKPFTPIGFVGGLTPDAWESLREGSDEEKGMQAVMRRISDNIFELTRFNDIDAENLVKVLETKVRVRDYKGDKLAPFEKSAIAVINNVSYGNPGHIINHCKTILVKANKQGVSKIDSKFAETYRESIGGGSETLDQGGEDDFLEGIEKI